MAPVVFLCCLLGLQALVAGANFIAAGHAAHAGALAGQLGRDAGPAARGAVPEWSTGRVLVTDQAGRVRVRLTPRAIVPPLADLLAVDASARYTEQ